LGDEKSSRFKVQNSKTEDQRPKTERQTNENQDLVLFAWRDLLQTYKIPQNLPLDLMKGVLQDTHIKRYETFDELYVYCYRVASTVGLMSSEIFGYENRKLWNTPKRSELRCS
jgi:phytoene synthase